MGGTVLASLSSLSSYLHIRHDQYRAPVSIEKSDEPSSGIKGTVELSAVSTSETPSREIPEEEAIKTHLEAREGYSIIAYRSQTLDKPGIVTLQVKDSTLEKLQSVFGEELFHKREDGIISVDGDANKYLRSMYNNSVRTQINKIDYQDEVHQDLKHSMEEWKVIDQAKKPLDVRHMLRFRGDISSGEYTLSRFDVKSFQTNMVQTKQTDEEGNVTTQKVREARMAYETDTASASAAREGAELMMIGLSNSYRNEGYRLLLQA